MKVFFLISGVSVLLMWFGAMLMVPEEPFPDRTALYWSTDPNPAREDQIAPFMKLHGDIAVIVEPNTFDKTIVQCSSGVGPDLIEVYSVPDMVAYVDAGILLDLTPYAEEYGFSLDTTYPRLAGNVEVNGKQYRYPANAASQVLFYNKKQFREAGVEYPKDNMHWDEFIELMKPLTLKRDSGAGYKQFAMVMGRHYARDLHIQHGARFFSEDLTRCVLDSDESIAAVQFYKDLMKTHEVIPSPDTAAAMSGEGGWGSGEIRWFATGRAASIWGSRWMMVQFRQYPELEKEIGCALLPAFDPSLPTNFSGARGPGINVNSPNIEEALEFLGYLAGEEYGTVIAQSSDALPPSRDYENKIDELINPEYPWETFQEKFIQSMNNATSDEVSPFVSPKFVDRLWIETLDIIENDIMSVEEALKRMTRQVNDQIRRNLDNQPELKEKYEELIS